MPAPTTGKRKRSSADDESIPSSNKTVSSTPTIQIVLGTYERVLHGFTASISLTQESSQQPSGTMTPKSSADEQEGAIEPPNDPKKANDATSETPYPPKQETTNDQSKVQFHDTFLLTAHASSIRCLAFSPPSSGRRYLATGSSDETIKIYQISSTVPTPPTTSSSTSTKRAHHSTNNPNGTPTPTASDAANPSTTNRELGTLTPHTSTITSLHFPTHSKLVSTSLDNSISISRTRDWTHLTTLRAPQPKSSTSTPTSKYSQNAIGSTGGSVLRRPEGDTYAAGTSPSGINAVSVHPSQRLAISTGLGERCMRLWNLVTGRKAGVLVFDRGVFGVDEDDAVWTERMGGVTGRCVGWNGVGGNEGGAAFFVGFEWRVVVFSVNCEVLGVCVPKGVGGRRTRVVQVRWVRGVGADSPGAKGLNRIMALSTEDGRILFYDTDPVHRGTSPQTGIQTLALLAQLATPATTSRPRIKDFQMLPIPQSHPTDDETQKEEAQVRLLLIAGTSTGAISLHELSSAELVSAHREAHASASGNAVNGVETEITKVGVCLGTYETGRRVVCLDGFVMDEASSGGVEGVDEGDVEVLEVDEEDVLMEEEMETAEEEQEFEGVD